jgi:hypothetical protein
MFAVAAAIHYYERALELEPGSKTLANSLKTAKSLAKQYDNGRVEKALPQPITCFFEVVSQADTLLEETRLNIRPSEETWSVFSKIAHDMSRDPMFRVFAQHQDDLPLDGAANDIRRNALRQMYKGFPAKSEVGKQLRKPKLKELWSDLTKC